MPRIKARKQANGITRYTAIIRIRRGGAIPTVRAARSLIDPPLSVELNTARLSWRILPCSRASNTAQPRSPNSVARDARDRAPEHDPGPDEVVGPRRRSCPLACLERK